MSRKMIAGTSGHNFKPLGGALIAGALLAACGGHGQYTQDHLSTAHQKMDVLKAATDYDMAHQSFVAGDLEKALDRVDKSIARNDQVAKSHVLRGRTLHEMGDMEGAIEAFRRAEALDPKNVEAQYYLGVVFERLADRDTAVNHYLAAHELELSNAQYAIAAAELLIDDGRVDDAEQMLESGPYEHNAGVKQTLGHIAQLRGDNEQAVRFFQDARLLAPEDAAIEEDLARALVRTGQYGEAERHLARVLKNEDGDVMRRDLKHEHARCLAELERFAEARTEYLDLTGSYEGASDVDAWIGLGETAAVLKDQARLREAATRVIALAPDRPDGYMFRAIWSRRQGQYPQSMRWLEKAEQLGAEPTVVYPLQAMVLQDMGLHDDAARLIAQAATHHPQLGPIAERISREAAYANVPTDN